MASNITRTQTPEERELAAKNADLAALKIQLAQRELEFATLRVELHAFEQRYLRVAGVKFAEIDDLEAQIAEALNRRNSSDETVRQRAVEARTKATESAGVTGAIEQRTHVVDFKPSEDLKRLYRTGADRRDDDHATPRAGECRRCRCSKQSRRDIHQRAGRAAGRRATHWRASLRVRDADLST